jgi:hypothetical protein
VAKLADKKRNKRSEIIKHLDLLVFGTGSSTLPEAIDKINESENSKKQQKTNMECHGRN